ncbi:NAD(P)H-binding protein [Prauserella alba]|uniref:NAD(P)H-binding protein n=1 Tax=Prauserella alba TaxID=176898 RepID=A0ABN1VDK1_9PSEU|nr:NAD(P)H-binding protein [Prauserella alba]MCP2179102.1 putative NADH-flavin reductase [Prauserella alba]
MARIVVFGATGGVGSHLVGELSARGASVVAVHRRPEQADGLRTQGAEPVQLDIADEIRSGVPERIARVLQGADVVVYTAGASSAPTDIARVVDGEGVAVVARAAETAGAHRFLLVSAFPEAWRDQGMPKDFEEYMKIKKRADVALAATSLDWVIVRPGTLTSGARTGQVTLGPAVDYGDVTRADVAAVLAELAHRDDLAHEILELTGGAAPIADAVDAAAGK